MSERNHHDVFDGFKVSFSERGFPMGGPVSVFVCFITTGPITKLFAWGGESGGHVL